MYGKVPVRPPERESTRSLRPNTINVTMPVNALVGASEDVPKRDPGNLRSNRGQGIDTWEEVQPT